MLNHKKLSAKVCSVALTLAMVFTTMMPTVAFATDAPTLAIQGATERTTPHGTPLKLTTTVSGGVAGEKAEYQWYESATDDFSAASLIKYQTKSDYTVPAKEDVNVTKYYFCSATNGNFVGEVHTNSVKVTITKADVTDKKVTEKTYNIKSKAYTDEQISLSDNVKPGATCTVGTVTDVNSLISGTPTTEGSNLKFTAVKKDVDTEASVVVHVANATNYNDYDVTVTIKVVPYNYEVKVTAQEKQAFDKKTTLTAASAGDELGDVTYQWYQAVGTEPGKDDTLVGTNQTTYDVPAKSVPVGDTQYFYCKVTGGNVTDETTSNVVPVTTTQATIVPPAQLTQIIPIAKGTVSFNLPKPLNGQEYDESKITEDNTSGIIDVSSISLKHNILTFESLASGVGVEATVTVSTKGDKNYKSYDTSIKFTTQNSDQTAATVNDLITAFQKMPSTGGTIKLNSPTAFKSQSAPIELNSEGHGIVTIDLNGNEMSGTSGNATKGLIDLTSTKGTGLKIVNTGAATNITGATSGYTIKNSGEGSLDISGDVTIKAAAGMVAAIGNDKGTVTISGAAKVNGDAVKAVANTGAGTVTISGGEVSSTSATVETISNTGAGNITVTDGKVTSAAKAITNTGTGGVEVSGGVVSSTSTTLETISNTGKGSITVTGKEGSSTSPTLKTIGNTGADSIAVPGVTATDKVSGTVTGKVTDTKTGIIKATDGTVLIDKYGVVKNEAGAKYYAVYYTAPAKTTIIDKASVTGITERVPVDIKIDSSSKLIIGTVAPVTLGEIVNGTNPPPIGANEPSINWWEKGSKPSDNWGTNPIDLKNESVFKVGQIYKTKYVYTAMDGYQFNVVDLTNDDTANVEVTSASNLTTGGKTVELSTNKDTLTVTLVWKATEKLDATSEMKTANMNVAMAGQKKVAVPLPKVQGDITYEEPVLGTATDIALTNYSISSDKNYLIVDAATSTLGKTGSVMITVKDAENYKTTDDVYKITVTLTSIKGLPVIVKPDLAGLNRPYNGKVIVDPTTVVTQPIEGFPAVKDAKVTLEYHLNSGTSENPTLGTKITDPIIKAGNYIVVASVDDNTYKGQSTLKDGAFTISKAPVTITIKDQTIPEGTDLSIVPTLKADKDYTVKGLVSEEKLPVPPTFAYDPATGKAQAGEKVQILLSNEGAVAPATGNYDVTCEPGNVIVSSSTQPPTPPVPSGKYTVTIIDGYGAEGARNYDPGDMVTLTAGSRSGYSFSSWSVPGVMVQPNVTSNTITFPMPENDVTATINWSYNGGGSGGGGSHGGGGGGSHGGGGGGGSSSGSSTPSTTPSAPSAPSKPAGGTASFGDVANHWAKQDIEFVAERGLMSGTGNGQFSPDENMTRGMFVTTLGRLAGVNTSSYNTDKFSDVQADAYYAAYVNWAAEKGIVSGTSASSFSPDQPVSRQEMAVMMSNYSKAMGEKLPETHPAAPFSDSSTIASWATGAVQQMEMAGIISGRDTGAFDSTGTATRAEVASVLHRFVEAIGK